MEQLQHGPAFFELPGFNEPHIGDPGLDYWYHEAG